MELRSCSHLHFIQAVKDGSIVKTLNIGRCGRPALVFKKVKDIYEADDSKNPHSLPANPPKDEFRGPLFCCDRVEIERSCRSIGESKSIKTDPKTYEFNCSDGDGDDQRDSDVDDLNTDKMTLSQFKKIFKTKKRKFSSSADLTKENVKACSPVKREYSNLQTVEKDLDLEEPLSSWKTKLTKKKKKCINKVVSSYSQCASATTISVKSEEVSRGQYLMQLSGYSSAPLIVKAEVLQLDYSDFQSVACVADDSSVGYNGQVSYNDINHCEMLETAAESVLQNGESISHAEPINCIVNEASYDHIEHAEIDSLSNVAAISREAKKVDDPEMNSEQSSVLPVSELDELEVIDHPPFNDISQEILSPVEEHNSNVYDSSQSHSIPHEMSWQENGNPEVQEPDTAFNNTLECLRPSHEVSIFEDEKADLPSNSEADAISSPVSIYSPPCKFNQCSTLDDLLAPVNDDPPTADEKQSLMSATDHASSEGSASIHCCDASNELSTSEVAMDCHHPELQHPPERLLSTRKAISPTSQERLCKAMNSIELHDDIEHHSSTTPECMGKLCFEKQTENKASSELEQAEVIIKAEGPEQNNRAEVTIKRKRMNRQPKIGLKGSHPKGILKVRHLPRVGTGCTTIEGCSQSAIAFTQRQMQDFECLAMKLTKELNVMKDIVEDTLHSEEACPSPSLKYNADEVRTAIGNAMKAEETANRWLSMMSRDSNRFCKIMRLAVNDTTESGNLVPKETKKITFADEAGGKLCHVKVFEDFVDA